MTVAQFRTVLVLAPALLFAGCRTGGSAPAPPANQAYHAHVITSEDIARCGATDVWEVLKRLSTTARTTEAYDGQPKRLESKRGHTSLYLQDDPTVYVDGVPIDDIRQLRQIGASDVDSIEEMGSVEATAYYGTNSNAGVILIHSRSKSAG
jgi:outer membrane cobalamin receptor